MCVCVCVCVCVCDGHAGVSCERQNPRKREGGFKFWAEPFRTTQLALVQALVTPPAAGVDVSLRSVSPVSCVQNARLLSRWRF